MHRAFDRIGGATRKLQVGVLLALLMAAILPLKASAAGDDSWTYATSMGIFGVNATGNITYALQKQEDMTVGGVRYEVDLVRVSGFLAGSAIGGLLALQATISGTLISAKEGMATVSDHSIEYVNITIAGLSPPHPVIDSRTNYTPPLLIRFDPDKTKPGDSWTETDTLNETTSVNGSAPVPLSIPATYDITIDSSTQSVTTPAGTFDTLKITVDGPIEKVVYWWASKAQNFVIKKTYSILGGPPTSIMTLTEFHLSLGAAVLVIALAGVAVVVIAVVILAAILHARRPRQPVYQQHSSPGQAPPR